MDVKKIKSYVELATAYAIFPLEEDGDELDKLWLSMTEEEYNAARRALRAGRKTYEA